MSQPLQFTQHFQSFVSSGCRMRTFFNFSDVHKNRKSSVCQSSSCTRVNLINCHEQYFCSLPVNQNEQSYDHRITLLKAHPSPLTDSPLLSEDIWLVVAINKFLSISSQVCTGLNGIYLKTDINKCHR